MSSWGYGKSDGPNTWGVEYPHANGEHQSPIEISTRDVRYEPLLRTGPLMITYEQETNMEIGNVGHSIKADIQKESFISGGPLPDSYKLAQFHFHWGSVNYKGSEHTVDGKCYAAELHLVHWNYKNYETFADAAQAEDGLAVIGVFIKIGREHEAFNILVNAMEELTYKNQQTHISRFDPASLLPDNTTHYWTYPGSLTTPPCSESVTWIVMADPIDISEDQLVALRGLLCDEKGEDCCQPITDNFRPVLPLNNRTVRSSWRSKPFC